MSAGAAVRSELGVGLAILALGLAVVFIGVGLCRRRGRLAMARAIQWLLATSFVATVLVIWLATNAGLLGVEGQPNPWPLLGVFPAMMFWLRWLGNRANAR